MGSGLSLTKRGSAILAVIAGSLVGFASPALADSSNWSFLPQASSGSAGGHVIGVQTALIGHGGYYRCASGLNGYCTVDGQFGANTVGAVKLFQANQGLTQDGVVGSGTWGRLQSGNIRFQSAHPDYEMNPGGATVYFDGVNVSGTCTWNATINADAYNTPFSGGTDYRMGLTNFTQQAFAGHAVCF